MLSTSNSSTEPDGTLPQTEFYQFLHANLSQDLSQDNRALRGVPVCTELNTPAGPIDALYATPQGKLVVLEAKLWRNPEARRTVVGLILDYAKELGRWTYEDLQREVARRTRRHGNALYEIVSEASDALDETAFVDEVARGLRQGRFLLLICGDGIREGVAMITDFLERHGALQFTFGLIEMAAYRMPGKGLLVQPRVLAQSLIVKRTVISLANEDIVAVQKGDDGPEPDELGANYLRLWSDFAARLTLDDPAVPPPNPNCSCSAYLRIPKGSNARITVYCFRKDNSVGVYLTCYRGELGERIFEQLRQERESSANRSTQTSACRSSGSPRIGATAYVPQAFSPTSATLNTVTRFWIFSPTAPTASSMRFARA